MEISKQELLKEAVETGFRPEIMEKVWHLMAILDGISVHPFLKERLVLTGGRYRAMGFTLRKVNLKISSFLCSENVHFAMTIG